MAHKLTALALDHGPAEHGPLLVLVVLADRADAETWIAFPSRADLVERARMSSASVTRHLRALERDGWISRQKRFNAATRFRVNVPRLLELAAARERRRPVPRGFEPFPEEVAQAAERAQAAESKGNAHREHTDAHGEHTDAHGEHLNLSRTGKRTGRAGRAKVSCSISGAASSPASRPSPRPPASSVPSGEPRSPEVVNALRLFHRMPLADPDRGQIAAWLSRQGLDVPGVTCR